MLRLFAVIGCAIVFTVLGLIAGLIIVVNRPIDMHDPEGMITVMMVLGPTAGGVISGVVVGLIAAGISGRHPPTKTF